MQHRRPSATRSWWSRASLAAAAVGGLVGVHARAGAVTIAVLLLIAACGGAVRSDPAALRSIPGTTLQQLITDRNDPAVVLVQMTYNATVTVPTPGVNGTAVQALDNQLAVQASSGQIGNDPKSINDAMVAEVDANPGAYFTASQPVVSEAATAGRTCTGSIVTPDGYIVTAAHCTTMDPGELQQQYVQERLTPMVNNMVHQFMANAVSGFDSDEQAGLADAVTKYLTTRAQFLDQTEAIDAAMFPGSSSGTSRGVWEPLLLVTQGTAAADGDQSSSVGDKDISILKLDGYNNLPTLTVGTESHIDTGEPLFIADYPAATRYQEAPGDFRSPTTSTGSLSAEEPSGVDVPLLESTSSVSPGDSGGPGFDQNGAMVGVVSYSEKATNGVSHGFLIGGSVVEKVLRAKGIQPRQSVTTTLYDAALNDYYRHDDENALAEFQQVKALDPADPYINRFVQKTQRAIPRGPDLTQLLRTTERLILIVAGVLLVGPVGGGLTFLLIRRRRSALR